MTKIAFIGLGNMGGPMAANLVKAGHAVTGFDLSEASRNAAAKTGVSVAGSISQAVRESECVITMLPASSHVLYVWDELLGFVDPGTLLIDSSTIDVESARKVHGFADKAGCPSLDAPVSGGTAGAAAGTLTFMVGGSDAAFEKARPILEAMGKTIVHAGGPGNGQAAKICNNMILGVSMIAVSEAFVLAEKLGLDAQKLFDISSKSSGQCWAMTSYCPVPGPVPASPANRDYQAGFTASMMLKDLRLAKEAAQAAEARTPLGAGAAAIYAAYVDSGEGARDFSGIIQFLRDN
jgi:3-hydroxyisobutyrate dehydrogenase